MDTQYFTSDRSSGSGNEEPCDGLMVANPRKSNKPRQAAANWAAPPAQNSMVRLAAGRFVNQICVIWAGTRMKEYLAASDGRRHIWHAWLSSQRIQFSATNGMSADLVYQFLTYRRGREIIQHGYGHSPVGLARALGTLGARARGKEVYRALMAILAQDGLAAKFLRHSRDLKDELILGLYNLPPGPECEATLALYRGGRIEPENLGFLSATIAQLRILKGDRVADDVLNAANPMKALWSALMELPFAAAPWPENELMVPVGSRGRLAAIAMAFKNCLQEEYWQKRSVLGAINGNAYYYEGRSVPFLLEVARLGPLGWYLTQLYGPENEDIDSGVRDSVIRSLSEQPNFCGPWCSEQNTIGYLLEGLRA